MTYETILIGWVLQGIGVASVAVAGIAIIQDTTKGYESTSKQALSNSIKGFAPAIVPLIGTVIEVMFGFEAIFIYVIVMAFLILFGTIFYIKETSTVRVKISYKTVFKNYAELLSSKSFMVNLLIYSFSFSIFLILITNSEELYVVQAQASFMLNSRSFINTYNKLYHIQIFKKVWATLHDICGTLCDDTGDFSVFDAV